HSCIHLSLHQHPQPWESLRFSSCKLLNSSESACDRILISRQLWCWVSLKWKFLRVAMFYGPVWIVILCTIGIYIKVGVVIFKWRKHLIENLGTISGTNELPA